MATAGDLGARIAAWWATSPRLLVLRGMPVAGRPMVTALVLLVVASPLLSFAFTIASGRLVGNVGVAVGDGFDGPAGRRVVQAIVVLGLAFVLQYVVGSVLEVLSLVVSRRFDRRIKARVLEASLGPSGVAHLEDPAVLDKIEATRSHQWGITPGVAAGAVPHIAAQRLAVVPPVVLLAGFRWWLPVVLAGPLLWLRKEMRRHITEIVASMLQQTAALRRSQYFVDLALTPAAAKESRIFGLGAWIGGRYRDHYLVAMTEVWRQRRQGRRKLVLPLLAELATAALAGVVIVRAATSGEIDLARVTILLASLSGMGAVLSFDNQDVQLDQGAALMPVVIEVEEMLQARREDFAGTLPSDGMPRDVVRFEDVCFRYPGGTHDVYAGLDLTVRTGESLAIVGVNGAGKTTLVKLLARLHDPTSGRITVDGVDLRELEPQAWQRRVAAIFQDFTRYELSARDNVAFGALELRDDDAALERAVEQAGATAVLGQLEHGWDTILSRRFTDGTDLSGGQWQRIVLVRALLAVRGGAGVLVLDEPTANLDVRAEAELYDRFLELTRGVTTIVISHRFSTVRRADRIVVLDGGRVVEDGTHDALVAGDGHYARMFKLQAARFTDDEVEGALDEADGVAEPEVVGG